MKLTKIFSKKAGISYLQIAILVLSYFAFSYMIAETDKAIDEVKKAYSIEEKTEKQAWEKSIIQKIGIAILSQLTKEMLPKVSAASTLQCCPKLKNNASCQNILSDNCNSECATSCLPTKCEETSNCKIGCCFDSKEGTCSNSVPKQLCEDKRGIWKDDRNCNLEECRKGCCVLGKNTQFITEAQCKKLSLFYGFSDVDLWKREIDTELGCWLLSNQGEEGACVLEEENSNGEIVRGCKFTTKIECMKNLGGEFSSGYLCSNPELNTTCIRQATTNCIEGKEDVYWIDSCGNKENIYNSDKDKSWNNGKVLKKEESCNANSGNIGSVGCGNCNSFLGSRCRKYKEGESKPTYGDKICGDLNCKQAISHANTKQDRKNGESWCVYDGRIGDGNDVAGSRHWKYYCLDGKVEVEACQDFRNGICVESEIKNENTNEKFSQSACRPNRAMECISYNSKGGSGCSKNSDCRILNMDFGTPYTFSICAPKYPLGFDMKNNPKAAQKLCSQASLKCTKILVDGECKSGCDCDSTKFTTQMNEWCTSMGDCGLKVNIAGKAYQGYSGNAPGISAEKNNIPKAGEFAEPGNDTLEKMAAHYGWGAGSVGDANVDVKKEKSTLKNILTVASILLVFGGKTTFANALSVTSAGGAGFAAFGTVVLGAAIGAAVGVVIVTVFGIKGSSAKNVIAIASAIGGAIAGTLAVSFAKVGMAAGSIVPGIGNLIGFIIGAIVGYIIGTFVGKVFGGKKPKIERIDVEYKCHPWQAPNGGEDCEKCNNVFANDGKKCSKYRCSSLGLNCEFINEGTNRELCIAINKNDVIPPKISPLKEILTNGYKYAEVNDNSFKILREDNECLTEFTPVIFGIKTDEVSQCKIDVMHKAKFEEMSDYFGDSNLYEFNHTMALNMPSVEALISTLNESYWLNQSEIEQLKTIMTTSYGNLSFFVRCEDKNGNWNLNEYVIRTCVKPGPDLTPPVVMANSPNDEDVLAFNITETNLKLWISEPAHCRYSKTESDYNNMTNLFGCKTNWNDAEPFGWLCNTTIGNLTRGDNNIYVRCKDQPWLPETNTSRNAMTTSKIINIKISNSQLNITRIEPNGTIIVGTEPATAVLKAYTSGGVDGTAKCSFSFTNELFSEFASTYSNVHEQTFNQLIAGNYIINIQCEDVAGNTAIGSTNLVVNIDKQAPMIVRVYSSGGLKIITDENAECAYSNKECDFIWENATKMSGLLKEHTTSWEEGKKYYIKCKDIYNNKPDDCLIAKAG